jgi:hypothetical protein
MMLLVTIERGDVMMRVLCIVLLGFLIVCLAGGVAVSTEVEKPDSTSSLGLVYGYGVKLTPPYDFTKSEDGRILYLNGLIYAGPDDKEPLDIKITEEERAQYDLSVRAGEESKKAKTPDERRALLAAVYISSPLVTAVRKQGHCVYVRWASDPENEYVINMPPEDERPEFTRAAFWEQLKNSFWRTVNSGGMVVFGKKYHIFVPANLVPKAVAQIELVRRGAPRERLDKRDTPLIDHNFLDDLYRENENAEEE